VLAVEPQIIEQYVQSGQVRLVFRDVLNHGDRSDRASEAAACAKEQGYFWEMHELLFATQDNVWATSGEGLVDLLLGYGAQLEGLDQAAYQGCLQARATIESIRAADAEQRGRGITSQPIFEIGDQRLFGLQSMETMSALIEAALE